MELYCFPHDLHVLTSSCCRHWAEASFLVRKCSHFSSTQLQATLGMECKMYQNIFFPWRFHDTNFEQSSGLRLNPAMKCCNAIEQHKMLAPSQPLGKLLCINWSSASTKQLLKDFTSCSVPMECRKKAQDVISSSLVPKSHLAYDLEQYNWLSLEVQYPTHKTSPCK